MALILNLSKDEGTAPQRRQMRLLSRKGRGSSQMISSNAAIAPVTSSAVL